LKRVHGIIQCFFLFNVVSRGVEEFTRAANEGSLSRSDPVGQIGSVALKKSRDVQVSAEAGVGMVGSGSHDFLFRVDVVP
jgi:hypothetical protein